ncbi:MAG TPA: DUF4179 domain-containing protein [Candidatus Nitrosotalea sp.]|nr:DUF4179 domain-containing protein [Candidatus Nitrosotalea sp.]
MEDQENKKSKPESTKKLDEIKNTASVAYGAGAIVGGVATANPFLVASGAIGLFGGFLAPFMAKNRDKYFEELRNDLDRLSSKVDGFTIENILSDDKVLSVILQVYPVVIRTMEEEKLAFMRNIVLNTALKINIEDDLRSMYIQFVADLTPSHFRILKYFQNPMKWLTEHNISLGGVTATGRRTFLEQAIPELKGRHDQFVADLITRGLLLKGDWLNVIVSDFTSPMLTDMGKELLRFIETPSQMN